jgi:hypothetical protein
VAVIEMDQEAEDEGGRCLGGAVVGMGGGGNNEKVEGGTELGEPDNDTSDNFVGEEKAEGRAT